MKVAIVNTYGDENRGSAALNIAAIRIVRRSFPSAEISLVPINEFGERERAIRYRHTLQAHPDVHLAAPLMRQESLAGGAATSLPLELLNGRLRRLLDAETADVLDAADLVVSRGGVIYRSSTTLARTAALLRRTASLRYAQRRGTPTVLLGLHAGAIGGRLAERSCRRQYEQADVVLPRGPLSEQRVRSLAPAASMHRLPDSVFGAELARVDRDAEMDGALAISVSDPAIPHLDTIAGTARALLERGLVDRVIVVDQVSGDDADATACGRLAQQLPDNTKLVRDDLSPSDLVHLYGSCVAVIASRLHAAILGLIGGTPSFPIDLSRDHKAVDTFGEVGLERWVLDPQAPGTWLDVVADAVPSGRSGSVGAYSAAADRYLDFSNQLASVGSE
jgi:polysaccharide pyruvyl transferase WcaK-like protein